MDTSQTTPPTDCAFFKPSLADDKPKPSEELVENLRILEKYKDHVKRLREQHQ